MSVKFPNLLSPLFFDYFPSDSCKKLFGCQRFFTEGKSNKFYCGERKYFNIIWNWCSCPIYITAQLCHQYSFSSFCWHTGRWNHLQNRPIDTATWKYQWGAWVFWKYAETCRVISFYLVTCNVDISKGQTF